MAESDLSSEVNATTVLPAPSSVAASLNANDNVDVAWTNNDDSPDGGIDIERSTDNFTTLTTVASGLSPTTTSYTDTTVSAGQTYQYRIERNTDHATATSGTASVITLNQIGTARIDVSDIIYNVPVYSLSSIDTRSIIRVRLSDGSVGALRILNDPTGEVFRARDPADGSVIGIETEPL